MSYDAKTRIRRALTQQGKTIDGKRTFAAALAISFPQIRQDSRTVARLDAAGQCHVKTKVFKNVGIAPAIEVCDLSIGEVCERPLGALFCSHRRAKMIESLHAGPGTDIEFDTWALRNDGHKALQ